MVSEEFKRLVEAKDIPAIRKKLRAISNADPSLESGKFQECLRYTESKIGDTLYDPASDFEKIQDRKKWTPDYVSEVFLELRKNFSRDMVQHLIEISPYAYPPKSSDRQGQTPHSPNPSQKTESNLTIGVCLVVALIIIVILLCRKN